MEKKNELREHPRFPVDTEIEIRTPDDVALGNVRDMSSMGIFAYSDKYFPVNTFCEIELIMKTGVQELRIKGQTQVVRLDEDVGKGYTGLGLRILECG